MIRKIVTVGCSIAAAAIVVVIVLLMPKDTAGDYTKVAEFLTEDTRIETDGIWRCGLCTGK